MAKQSLEDTTVSDFGGGWNVADSPLNLSSRFQPVSDNIIRGVNGSFSVRWGTQLHADCRRDGTKTHYATTTLAAATTSGSPYVTITLAAHGYSSGDHITITSATVPGGSIGTIPESALVGTFGIVVIDANTFKFATLYSATATDSETMTVADGYDIDDYVLAGNIIHQQFFRGYMLLFDDVGEIARMNDDTGAVERIWDASVADALTTNLAPTRKCTHVSTTTFKSTVISCNGYDNDKPLQINDNFVVEFLVDKATLTNTAVPRADFVLGMQGYVALLRTEYGDPFIEFSAKNTDGTYTRQTDPADSVEIDLSMVTDTIEPVILGAAPFRDKMYVAFYDRGMLGTLGIYSTDGTAHQPAFDDTIAENGSISHKTIVPLGNDVFMADYAGVASLTISQSSGERVPARISELIAPELQRHLASLNGETLRAKAFAIFNRSDRMYMLFLPKYDEIAVTASDNPFIFSADLSQLHRCIMHVPKHKLIDGSSVVIAGATSIGPLLSTELNGTHTVVSIIDDEYIVLQLNDDAIMPSATTYEGGGSAVTMTPVNDETICYGFEYNRELKIKRWTRLRGLDFDCAGITQRGRMYFAKGGKVYRYGSSEEPLYADNIGEYDSDWSNSVDYSVGDYIRDTDDGLVYECLVAHTSAATGTFAADRADNVDNWMQYKGQPIDWALETPWSELSKRGINKIIKYVNHDSEGEGEFTFSIFTNQIYRNKSTYELVPNRAMKFTAGNIGGFGIASAFVWGSGRRTREEKVWPMEARGKLFKLRYAGSTTRKVRITGTTLYYLKGSIR